MRRILAGAVLVGAMTIVGAAKPDADHAYVFGGVNIYRGPGPVVYEYNSQYVPCSGAACEVTLAIGKRDYGRFVKWCGSDSRQITVATGSLGGNVDCQGPTPWVLNASVAMRNAKDVLTVHAEPVIITLKVTP